MAYYYKGLQIQTPFQVTSTQPAFETESYSLKRERFVLDAQRWELSFTVSNNKDEGAAFIAHTSDFYATETMVMPQLAGVEAKFTLTTAVTVNGAHSAADNTIDANVTGTAASQLIPDGTFVKFANHDKVYVITVARTISSGDTSKTLNIFPRLVTSVPNGTAVQFGDDCILTYVRDFSVLQGLSFSDGIISSPGTIKLIEQI